MSVNPEEITSIIKERIQNFETRLQVDEVGSVLTIGDGVARVFGLKNVMAGELVEFATGTKGMVSPAHRTPVSGNPKRSCARGQGRSRVKVGFLHKKVANPKAPWLSFMTQAS